MKNLSTLFLFFAALLFTSSLAAQTKTISFGGANDDYVFDVVSHNGLNYILGDFPVGNSFYINDSTFPINCSNSSIIIIDDSFNLVNYYCILDTNSNQFVPLKEGKLAIDTITNSLYLAGVTSYSIKLGNDYVDAIGNSSFLARFDLQLNPIWAKSSYCIGPWNSTDATIENLVIDDEGKPWFSLTVGGGAGLVCYGNDSIYNIGRVYLDTLGFLRTSKSQFPSLIANDVYTMNAIDSNRIIEVHSNLTPQALQMVDSKMDTVIWKKIITTTVVRFTAVDFATRHLYTLADSGILTKYTLDDGLMVYQKTISSLISPLGLAVTKDGLKVYAYGQQNFFNRIHVLDDQGTVLETKVWGIETFSNDSRYISTNNFMISDNNLLITSTLWPSDSVYFGLDLFANWVYRSRGFLSKFDITSVLTSETDLINTKNNSISIYPNPSRGIIYINSEEDIEQIICYDIHGKILELEISNSFKQIQLPSNISNGIYFLEIISKNSRAFKKVVYQK